MVKDFSAGILALGLFAVLTVVGIASRSVTPPPDPSFGEFLHRFEAGLHRFVNGDPSPWNLHVSRTADGSILGGFGGYEIGGQVDARYAWAASQFAESGARVQVEYLSTIVAGDLAYTVWIERSQVRVRGKAAPVAMALRVTHVFRREGGHWKLLHRHADDKVAKAAP